MGKMRWMPPLGMDVGNGWERGWRRRGFAAAAACAAFILSIGVPGPADAASLCASAAFGRGVASIFPSPLPLPLMPLHLRGGGGSGSGRRSRGRGKGEGSSSAPPSSAGMASEEAVDESPASARRKRDRKGAKIRHKTQQADDKEGKQGEGERLAPEAQREKDELQSELEEWGLGPEDSTEMLGDIVTPTLAEEGRRVAFKEPSPMTVDPRRRKYTVRLR